jgi:hypothetical protein
MTPPSSYAAGGGTASSTGTANAAQGAARLQLQREVAHQLTGLGLNVIHQMRYGQFCVDGKTYCIKLMWFDSCQKRSGRHFKKAALSAADFYVLVRMLDDFTVKDYLVVPHEDVSEFPNWIKDPW